MNWTHREEKAWHPIFEASSGALFFVGYGATRRVERKAQFDLASRRANSFTRAQWIQSLFEESYSLVPLNAWLPEWKTRNPGRHRQAVTLLDKLAGKDHYRFTGERNTEGEYLFERKGVKVPFPALPDGYRAYLGWIGDLLYHICVTSGR